MSPASERVRGGADDDEVGMNLTPMIDVVFQLIVFFLLALRFKDVDSRLESRLPWPGMRPMVARVDEVPTLPVKLFRENVDRPDEAFTRVRIANRTTVRLEGEPEGARRDAAIEEILEAIRAAWAARDHAAVRGEIRTPPPKGASVPHGDVVAVLDAFVRAGLSDVVFQGAASPLPPSGR